MMLRALAVGLALSLPSVAVAPSAAFAGDPIIGFDKTDKQMSAAVTQAQRSLPHFFRQAEGRLGSGNFSVKVAFPVQGGGNEHIWVALSARSGPSMEGTLLNNPVDVPYKINQEVKFTQSSVSDWSYWGPDGKLHGNYTTRVMLPHLEASEAAHLRSILAPLP